MSYCHFVKGEHGERVKIPSCMTFLYDDGCPCKTFDMENRRDAIERLHQQRNEIDAKIAELSAKQGDR